MAGGLEQRLSEMASRCLAELGLELYHLEFRPSGSRSMVRLFIETREHTGGVGLEDCARASRRLGEILDEEDLLPAAYTLEVSSPGLDRALHTPEHYGRFAGHTARVTTFQPIDGRRHFSGRIVSCDSRSLRLAPQDAADGHEIEIPYDAVAGGHLVVEL